jgi:uncharacterized membrane protein YqgA involved in biofilm formation
LTGTFINVGTILAGTLIGVLVGGRWPGRSAGASHWRP